jgi:hypothetical protein
MLGLTVVDASYVDADRVARVGVAAGIALTVPVRGDYSAALGER